MTRGKFGIVMRTWLGNALGSLRRPLMWYLGVRTTAAPVPVSASEEQAAMSQKLAEKGFVSVALIAMVGPPAMAQAPLAPPPQIPYGVSFSTESAKNVAAASIAEAQKNNWKM